MNSNIGLHQPTPEFRLALEAEVSSALLRESRLASDRRVSRRRNLRFVALWAATLFIGVFIGAAPAQLRDARLREIHLAAAESELAVAVLRVRLAEAEYESAKARHAQGILSQGAVSASEAELRKVAARLAVIRLNIEEIQASASAPQDAISAPLVGDRDFVTERLKLNLVAAELPLQGAQEILLVVQQRVNAGTVSTIVLEEAQGKVLEAKGLVDLVAARIALRKRFLEEKLAAETVERLDKLQGFRIQLAMAEFNQQLTEKRLKFVRAAEANGVAARSESLKAELEAHDAASVVQIIRLQIQLLERPGGAKP